MLKTSKRILVYLSAAVWYIGGIMLFRGGWELLAHAREMRPESNWHWLFIVLGVILGIAQAATIFKRSCRKNLARINQLEDPRLWQFFRPGFFLALAVMITSGVLLDHFAQGNYFYMIALAGLDFALSISLLGSSIIFWVEYKNIQD